MQAKVRLILICEMEGFDLTIEEARERLDAFRETVKPQQEYGITLFEATQQDLQPINPSA